MSRFIPGDGFYPATDTVLLSGIVLGLYDDGDFFLPETVNFTFDGTNFGNESTVLGFFGILGFVPFGVRRNCRTGF